MGSFSMVGKTMVANSFVFFLLGRLSVVIAGSTFVIFLVDIICCLCGSEYIGATSYHSNTLYLFVGSLGGGGCLGV